MDVDSRAHQSRFPLTAFTFMTMRHNRVPTPESQVQIFPCHEGWRDNSILAADKPVTSNKLLGRPQHLTHLHTKLCRCSTVDDPMVIAE